MKAGVVAVVRAALKDHAAEAVVMAPALCCLRNLADLPANVAALAPLLHLVRSSVGPVGRWMVVQLLLLVVVVCVVDCVHKA